MVSISIGLFMLSVMAGTGIIFLLWALYHLILDSGRRRHQRRSLLQNLSLNTGLSESKIEVLKVALIMDE